MREIIPHYGRFVLIREDFLRLCEGKPEPAILLAILEYWTKVKIGMNIQLSEENDIRRLEDLPPIDVELDLWIWRTQEDLIADSLGLLSKFKLKKAIKYLVDKGYIQIRTHPRYRWDKTYQYRLNLKTLREDLKKVHQTLGADECPILDIRESKIDPSKGQNLPLEGAKLDLQSAKIGPAIQNNYLKEINKNNIYIYREGFNADAEGSLNEPSLSNQDKPSKSKNKKTSSKKEDNRIEYLTQLASAHFYNIVKRELGIKYRNYGKLRRLAKVWAKYNLFLMDKEGWSVDDFISFTASAVYYALLVKKMADPVFIFGKPEEIHMILLRIKDESPRLADKIDRLVRDYMYHVEQEEVNY